MTNFHNPNDKVILIQLRAHLEAFEHELSYLSNHHSFVASWESIITRDYSSRNSEKGFSYDFDTSQIFFKEIHLGRTRIVLRFDVSALKNILSSKIPETISIKRFSQEDVYPKIAYTKETVYPDAYRTDDVPIIAAPLCMGNSIGFVVDGNHHLSAKIATGRNDISAYLIDIPTACSAIVNSFEKSIYCIIQDVDLLNIIRQNNPALSYYESQLLYLRCQ